jgi:hypothetical protein
MIKMSITKVMVGLFSNLQMPKDADISLDQGQNNGGDYGGGDNGGDYGGGDDGGGGDF